MALPARKRCRLQMWLWTLAAMTLAVLVVGGITRLTQSGLSMVDWQPLVGVVPPLTEAQWAEQFERYRQFPEFQYRKGMTLAGFKRIYFWEYLHRLLARLIGVVFLVPFILFWRAGYLPPPLLRRTLAILAVGAAQGAMGWLMVRSGLVDRPSVSHYRLAVHLVLAFVIAGLCVWLARDLSLGRKVTVVTSRTRSLLVRGLTVVGALMAAQVVWGAFVAGLKGGHLYNTFPLMAGRVVPPQMLLLDPVLLNFVQNAETVQWMHRVLGTALLVAAGLFFVRLRFATIDRKSRRLNGGLLALIAAQYVLGVATLVRGVPVSLAVPHQAMGMLIVAVWVVWVHHVRTLTVVAAAGDDVAVPSAPILQPPSARRA